MYTKYTDSLNFSFTILNNEIPEEQNLTPDWYEFRLTALNDGCGVFIQDEHVKTLKDKTQSDKEPLKQALQNKIQDVYRWNTHGMWKCVGAKFLAIKLLALTQASHVPTELPP